MDEKISAPSSAAPYGAPTPGTLFTPEKAMRLAIQEAFLGAHRVSPNPAVGCVVLNAQNLFLARGHHEFFGGPHAEVNALKNLTLEQLKGAKVFVTLEPCAHEGKTPSCAKMIAKLPVAEVYYGVEDPFEKVRGEGAKMIQAAGIRCELYSQNFGSDLEAELEEACEIFLHNQRKKSIFTALKIATSLDGRIALKNGESQWITGPESREKTHELRAIYDGVLVGAGTVLRDDPSLDVRHPVREKKNKVVVLDSRARALKSSLKLFNTHAFDHIYWIVDIREAPRLSVEHAGLVQKGLHIVGVNHKNGALDLAEAMSALWDLGLRSLLIEGGSHVASSFLAARLVNRLYHFQAPILLGEGLDWSHTLRIDKMAAKIQLAYIRRKSYGSDVLTTGLMS